MRHVDLVNHLDPGGDLVEAHHLVRVRIRVRVRLRVRVRVRGSVRGWVRG